MRDDQTLEKHVVSVVWLWGVAVGREVMLMRYYSRNPMRQNLGPRIDI